LAVDSQLADNDYTRVDVHCPKEEKKEKKEERSRKAQQAT
jgi:hypothetical protein